jgi:hypothetical protein
MAKYIIDDPVVLIDGGDYSDHFSSVEIEAEFEEVPVTGFGADFNEILIGLGDATITLEAFQDHATGELDQDMWGIFINKSIVEVSVKPTSSSVSSQNPEYSLPAAVLTTYSPISGAKGEASTTTLTFRNAGQLGLVRSFT